MIRKIASTFLVASAIVLFCTAVNAQQFPIMDKIADKVIQKYQTVHLRAVVAGESTERQGSRTADGTGGSPDVEIRLADACGIYQQDSRAHS